jgi:hypothetical protein
MPSGVYVRSLRQLEKTSEAKLGKNHPMFGKHHSKKTKMKSSKSNKKYWKNHKFPLQDTHCSKSTKTKMSKARKGTHPSLITREKQSKSAIKRLQNPDWHYKTKFNFFRKDLGHRCRSKFEANYCRIQKYLGTPYTYEPKAFLLSNGKHYLPDIYLPEFDAYIELKGFMDIKAKEKIEMFKKEYPNINLMVLMQNSRHWKDMEVKFKNNIREWEN